MKSLRIGLIVGVIALVGSAFAFGFLLAWPTAIQVAVRAHPDREMETYQAVDIVDGSAGYRRMEDKPNGKTEFSYKFVVVNHTSRDVTVPTVRVSLLDADGFQLNDFGWTATFIVPAGGTKPFTGRMSVPTDMADQVVAMQLGRV